MDIFAKINKLRDWLTGNKADAVDVNQVDSWSEIAKRLILIDDLSNHSGVKYLLDILQPEIDKINGQLLSSYSSTLSDYERDRLIDKREVYQKFVGFFKTVKTDLASLEETVDNELTNISL